VRAVLSPPRRHRHDDRLPTGTRREGQRLAVVASSLAAGAALATPSFARAERAPDPTVATDSTGTRPAMRPRRISTTQTTPDPIMVDTM